MTQQEDFIGGEYRFNTQLNEKLNVGADQEAERKWAEEFIDLVDWREAKTYKDTAPHFYLVKEQLATDKIGDFERLVRIIRQYGYPEHFYSKVFYYWGYGEFKFFTMDEPEANVTIINRAPTESKYSAESGN